MRQTLTGASISLSKDVKHSSCTYSTNMPPIELVRDTSVGEFSDHLSFRPEYRKAVEGSDSASFSRRDPMGGISSWECTMRNNGEGL